MDASRDTLIGNYELPYAEKTNLGVCHVKFVRVP
jgi:hypothetical protein